MFRDKRSGFSWTASNIRIWSVVSQEYVVLLKTDLGYSQAGTYLGDDHKQYFSGDAALKAGGKDNTMNQFEVKVSREIIKRHMTTHRISSQAKSTKKAASLRRQSLDDEWTRFGHPATDRRRPRWISPAQEGPNP